MQVCSGSHSPQYHIQQLVALSALQDDWPTVTRTLTRTSCRVTYCFWGRNSTTNPRNRSHDVHISYSPPGEERKKHTTLHTLEHTSLPQNYPHCTSEECFTGTQELCDQLNACVCVCDQQFAPCIPMAMTEHDIRVRNV